MTDEEKRKLAKLFEIATQIKHLTGTTAMEGQYYQDSVIVLCNFIIDQYGT